MAYVEPAGFGELVIDEKRSVATVGVLDREGAAMHVEVPLRAENNFLIDNLEVLLDAQSGLPLPSGLFGRVSVRGGELVLLPYTAIFERGVQLDGRSGAKVHEWHLSLEKVRTKSMKKKP
jgi:hypothetical protein